MAYLTDAEKRILFSALAREEKVCKTMDRLEKPKGTPLVKIVESLRRKFYYDRFEKEIREKAIDEFIIRLEMHTQENWIDHQEYGITWSDIEMIAEQLKGGAE